MKRRSMILVAILFLAIGFATVTTNLIINGSLLIGNNDDFVVIFTSAKLNGANRSRFISIDKKTITFETNTLTTMKDVETLEFEVTNTSRNYDANVVITCTPVEHEYVELTLPSEMTVEAGTSEKERIIARLKKVTSEEQSIEINCTLTATAEERTNLGNEYVAPFSKAGTMMVALNKKDDQPESIWQYRDVITKVVFENKMNPYETSENLIFDVSENQDESVMAYIVLESDLTEEEINAALEEFIQEETGMTLEELKEYLIEQDGTTEEQYNIAIDKMKSELGLANYTLYIQSETGVKANEDSSYLFYKFENLTTIEGLEYLDTSTVTNMRSMFDGCNNLETLDVSNFDTRNVTDMHNMFKDCRSLTTLDVSNFDTSNVTNMSSMFYICENLTTLDVSNFDTRNVTNMNSMFYVCENLIILDVSNFNTSNVTRMDSMFSDCRSLTTLDVSNFDTRNVTDMHHMFKDCRSLTTLDVSNFDTSKVINMSGIFWNCNSLTKLYLGKVDNNDFPDSGHVDGLNGCYGSVTMDMFRGLSSTLKIHIKDEATKIWVLSLSSSVLGDRPSTWNDNNFILEA